MNSYAVADLAKLMLNGYGRTVATFVAGAAGRSLGAQRVPVIVNWAVKRMVSGVFAQFFLRNAAHAAIGTYYPLIGQIALGGAAALCPGPGKISQTWTGYKACRDYQNQLKTFDPEALTVKATEDGWLMCDDRRDDLQKKPAIIEDDVDTESFDWVGDEAKDLPTPPQMGKPGMFEMDNLASGESAEGFEFVDN